MRPCGPTSHKICASSTGRGFCGQATLCGFLPVVGVRWVPTGSGSGCPSLHRGVRTLRAWLAIAVLSFLIGSLDGVTASAGQVAGGAISGVVTDQQGLNLPGVMITVEALPIALAITTANDGSYHFSNVAPGSYVVRAELTGFAKLVR